MTLASLPSITATTELVVPRSIPMIFSPSSHCVLLSSAMCGSIYAESVPDCLNEWPGVSRKTTAMKHRTTYRERDPLVACPAVNSPDVIIAGGAKDVPLPAGGKMTSKTRNIVRMSCASKSLAMPAMGNPKLRSAILTGASPQLPLLPQIAYTTSFSELAVDMLSTNTQEIQG